MTIRVQPRRVQSGQTLTIDISTTPGARLTMALEVPVKVTITVKVRQRVVQHKGKRTIVSFRTVTRHRTIIRYVTVQTIPGGTVPSSGKNKGHFLRVVRVTYAPAKSVEARLRVTVRVTCGSVTIYSPVRIDPRPRASKGKRPTAKLAIILAPAPLRFGAQLVGRASAARTVTVTNAGKAALAIGHVTVLGTNARDFIIDRDTCSNTSLASGGHCTIRLRFKPGATGQRTAIMGVPDNAPHSPQTVILSGVGVRGTTPAATLAPASINFGRQGLNQATAATVVTLSNTGGSSLSVGRVAVTGANAGDFEIVADTCSATTLVPGAHCTVSVRFKPVSPGLRVGNLTFVDNAKPSPQIVGLTGTGK